jgi:hypothetical protein
MVLGIDAFRTAAETLHLRLEAPEKSWWRDYELALLEGTIDGTRVLVQQGVTQEAGRPQTRVYFHAAVEPPLDLGLKISMRASGYTNSNPLGPQDVHGSAAFDAAFAVEGAEPQRVRTFFTDDVRSALIAWHNARRIERYSEHKNWMEFWVSDESVILCLEPGAFALGLAKAIVLEELVADVRATVALAKAVERAAKSVPPSALLATHAATWRAFAASRGFTFTDSPFRMTGSFAGTPFAARAVSTKGPTYGVELTMPFAKPLPLYMRLGRRERWYEFSKRFAAYPDAWTEWVKPKKTGHSDFDHEFRVIATNGELESAVLNEEVRAALLGLTRMYEHVHMTTDCISVRTNEFVPPAQLEDVLAPLAAIEKLVDG